MDNEPSIFKDRNNESSNAQSFVSPEALESSVLSPVSQSNIIESPNPSRSKTNRRVLLITAGVGTLIALLLVGTLVFFLRQQE